MRREGAKSRGDTAVDDAYASLGATFDFYLANHQRNSIDDAGVPLRATVHYSIRYDGAVVAAMATRAARAGGR